MFATIDVMTDEIANQIETANHIVIIQAENPDGDSLASALALEEILGDMGKTITTYCPVDIPKYLRYIIGWDRVVSDFPAKADLAIIVDTSADVLLDKVLETPGVRHFLETHPVVVLDHHSSEPTLTFPYTAVIEEVVATSHVIFNLARANDWPINDRAAEHMMEALMSDTLGLTTPNVTADSFQMAADLTKLGADTSKIETRRREFAKKTPEILTYKGELISRIEYYLDGRLAVIHIPWEEIQTYSDQYNPGALISDELRMVEGVEVVVAVKTYPNGRLTGRIRSNAPVSETIAGYFGGGGHDYASGFRIHDSYENSLPEIINATSTALRDSNEVV